MSELLDQQVVNIPEENNGWKIDLQTGTPILVYESCSVIQDEQAYLIMRLLSDFYSTK